MAIKARDVRAALKGKVDPALITILEALAEEQGSIQKTVAETVSLVAMTIETVEKTAMINENLKAQLERTKRMEDPTPDLGSVSTKGEA